MSAWKKLSKTHQKTHRERHQPEDRKHLGLLEKKKDYVRRARDYNEKKETLKVLRKRALNKNPDEFYHHMINSKIENGQHFEDKIEEEDTPEQLRLMRTQDLKYITVKRTQEKKKIDKLQSQLHLFSVDHQVKNKHIIFKKNIDKSEQNESEIKNFHLQQTHVPNVEINHLIEATKKKKQLYTELAKRIQREKELATIQQKIEIRRHLECAKNVLPPKRIKRGSKDSAPVYSWQYERKR